MPVGVSEGFVSRAGSHPSFQTKAKIRAGLVQNHTDSAACRGHAHTKYQDQIAKETAFFTHFYLTCIQDHDLFVTCPSLTCDSWSFSGFLSAVTALKNNYCHALPSCFSQCTQSLPVGGVLQGSTID